MPSKVSAGLLPYRIVNGTVEVLLAHYGGPLWARKDLGSWTVIKGEVEGFLDVGAQHIVPLLETAKREFTEETGIDISRVVEFIPLGEVKQRGGKVVHAWAFDSSHISLEIVGIDQREVRVSPHSVFEMEWPPRSGQIQQFPEIDRAEFFPLETARQKINPAQVAFLERLESYFSKNRSELLLRSPK